MAEMLVFMSVFTSKTAHTQMSLNDAARSAAVSMQAGNDRIRQKISVRFTYRFQ